MKKIKSKLRKIHERPTQKKNERLIVYYIRVKKDFSSNTHVHRRKDDDEDDDNKNKNNKNTNDEDDEKEEKPPPPKVLFLPSLRFVFLFCKNDDKDNEVFL